MRLISLAPGITEIVAELGCQDQLIAVSSFCDYPMPDSALPKLGGWAQTTADQVRAMGPDIIFSSYYLPHVLRHWSGPGVVVHISPTTLKDILQSILQVGAVLNVTERADAAVRKLEREIRKLLQSKDKKSTTVYMEEWENPPMVAGNWVPEMVEIAGGIPVLGIPGMPSYEFSWEQLFTVDPDYIICHWKGAVSNSEMKIRQRHGWDSLRAVRAGRVYGIDDSYINRPGPRFITGISHIRDCLRGQIHSSISVSDQ